MKHAQLALLFLLTGSISSPAVAASALDDYYQVEVIVFSYSDVDAGQAEVWPPLKADKLPLAQIDSAINLENNGSEVASTPTVNQLPAVQTGSPTTTGSDGFLPLPATLYQLQGLWDALERSSRYEPLVYTGWLQPALKPGEAKPVRIAVGVPQLLSQNGSVTEPAATQLSAASFSSRSASAPVISGDKMAEQPDTQPQLVSPLAGIVTIASDFYLYADVNFIYTPQGVNPVNSAGFTPFTPQIKTSAKLNQQTLLALANGAITLEEAMQRRQTNTVAAQEPVSGTQSEDSLQSTMHQVLVSPQDSTVNIAGYRLNQNRRIKLNEIHYFDHPKFGIIIQVSPYETGETE